MVALPITGLPTFPVGLIPLGPTPFHSVLAVSGEVGVVVEVVVDGGIIAVVGVVMVGVSVVGIAMGVTKDEVEEAAEDGAESESDVVVVAVVVTVISTGTSLLST